MLLVEDLGARAFGEELASGRTSQAELWGAAVDVLVRLRALPVMDVCSRCDDCIPIDHDTGAAACTHPKIGQRPVTANDAPPSWLSVSPLSLPM